MVQLSYPHMTTGKTVALTIQIFVSKVMSMLFNTLSRFIIAFLSRSKCLLISWLQSPSTVILEPPKIKSIPASSFSPFYLPWSDGSRCHDLNFLNVEFYTSFFILPFCPHQGLISSTSLFAIRVISSANLRLFIFLLSILIPDCDSSSLELCIM